MANTPYYITYTEYSTGGEEIDPDEQWTSHEPIYNEFSITGVYKTKPAGFFGDTIYATDDIPVGQPIQIVWARYSTGSTFGQEYGCHWFPGDYNPDVPGAFKNSEDAAALVAKLRDVKDHSVPWNGWFEALEDIEYDEFTVGP